MIERLSSTTEGKGKGGSPNVKTLWSAMLTSGFSCSIPCKRLYFEYTVVLFCVFFERRIYADGNVKEEIY